MPNQRFVPGQSVQTPLYRHIENALGYETEITLFDIIGGRGLPLDGIKMVQVKNSRKTNPHIEQFIKTRWEEEQRRYNAFDAPRPRFEGSYLDADTGELMVLWSEERYSTHAAIRNSGLSRPYQANLWTINAVLLPKDKKLPMGLRNPVETDQGRIRHLTPVGFVDLVKRKMYDEKGSVVEITDIESVTDAVSRRLHAEWEVPQGAFDPKGMELLGVVYNSYKNFDYAACVLVPLECDLRELKSKQLRNGVQRGKYDAVEEVGMDEPSLRSLLFELASAPETSSGHMRGDIALTIGRLYGRQKCLEVLEDTLLRLGGFK